MKKLLLIATLLLLFAQAAEAGWYSSDWPYRKKITIDETYVDSELNNFPLYVKITSDSDIGAHCRADGYDLRFTEADGTSLLKYERESWSGGGGSAVTANIWVKVPAVYASANTNIYLYYGKSDAIDGQDAANVWDTNFKGVWHLPNGTTLSVLDSTSNGNVGTVYNAIAGSGKIDGAGSFDGTGDYITADSLANSIQTGNVTMSAWVNFSAIYNSGSPCMIVTRSGDAPAANDVNLHFGNWRGLGGTAGKLGFGVWLGSSLQMATSSQATWQASTWYYVAGSFSTSGGMVVYVNGSSDGTNANTTRGTTPYSTHFWIGTDPNESTYAGFSGLIDEVRVSSTARSAAWLKFEYRNMSEADNELSWNTQEDLSAKAVKMEGLKLEGVKVE